MEIRDLWGLEERSCALLLDRGTARMVAAHLLLHSDLSVLLVQVRSGENLLEGERGAVSWVCLETFFLNLCILKKLLKPLNNDHL